jgi:hypothetical protein
MSLVLISLAVLSVALVTTVLRVPRLQMKERWLPDVESGWKYIELAVSGQPTNEGSPSWGLGTGLSTYRSKEIISYEILQKAGLGLILWSC